MQTPQKNDRHYDSSDAYMVERCTTIQGLFVGDLAAFTAFDADFSSIFSDQWESDISNASAVSSDETLQDQLRQLTETMNTAWAACRDKWSEVKFFMQKAFPTSPGKWAEFGADNYTKARGTTTATIRFMSLLHDAAVKYSTELIAAGYTQPKIEDIQTLNEALEAANKAQEIFKEARLTETEERIATLNVPYDTLMLVCAAAPMVFPNSAAKRAQYVFKPTSSSAATVFDGTVDASATKVLGTISYSAAKVLNFTNGGSAQLRFELRVVDDAPGGTPLTLAVGEADTRSMAALNDNPSATKLVVINLDEEQIGMYHVAVG